MKHLFSWKYILEILVNSVVIILILFIFLWPVEIIGNSMQSNISDGDYVLVSRFLALTNGLSRFDVVVCNYTEGSMNIIKRLIALPGDHVRISQGEVYVNDERLTEEYLINTYTEGDIEILLEENEYFILGDNRSASYDSRQMGPVSKQKISAKVLIRILPINSFKIYF